MVLEALKERKMMGELAQQFNLHPNQIARWKRMFLQGASSVFESPLLLSAKRLSSKTSSFNRSASCRRRTTTKERTIAMIR